MNDIHAHEHIIKRRGIAAYRKELTPETGMGEVQEEVLDVKLVKLLFISMAAVVAFGISMVLFPL
ncbi:hypothetical protein IX51_00230 [uncultured archaeon]|nr:hypothetical protein IX51_00230 [uncultured archaeon]